MKDILEKRSLKLMTLTQKPDEIQGPKEENKRSLEM